MAYVHLRRIRIAIVPFAVVSVGLITADLLMFLAEAKDSSFNGTLISPMEWGVFLLPVFPILIYLYYAIAKREQEAHQVELHRQAERITLATVAPGYVQGYNGASNSGGLLTWRSWLRAVVILFLAGFILMFYFVQGWVGQIQQAIAAQDIGAYGCKYATSSIPQDCPTYISMFWFCSALGWLMVVEVGMTLWVASGLYWRRRLRAENGGNGNYQQTANMVIVSPDQPVWQQQPQQQGYPMQQIQQQPQPFYYPQHQQQQYQQQPYYYNQQQPQQYSNELGHKLDEAAMAPIH